MVVLDFLNLFLKYVLICYYFYAFKYNCQSWSLQNFNCQTVQSYRFQRVAYRLCILTVPHICSTNEFFCKHCYFLIISFLLLIKVKKKTPPPSSLLKTETLWVFLKLSMSAYFPHHSVRYTPLKLPLSVDLLPDFPLSRAFFLLFYIVRFKLHPYSAQTLRMCSDPNHKNTIKRHISI